MNTKVYSQKAEPLHDLDLSEKVFGLTVNQELIHQAVITQQGNERQVLADTKDRSEVSGGGKKPWKQKGTGRARVGSSRSPIWIGGGVTFGPTANRNFSKKINKKMRQKALAMVLSDKLAHDSLVVLDNLDLPEFKTKNFEAVLKAIEAKVLKVERRDILVMSDSKNEKLKYSARNLVGVTMINLENINIVDLLKSRYLVTTEAAIKNLETQYSK
jgi:large subunit ribosomal protein L4